MSSLPPDGRASDSKGSTSAPSLTELVDFVLEQTVSPVDAWAVAATLESRGIRDVDAQQQYGDADVFALADRVYLNCRARLQDLRPTATRSSVRQTRSQVMRRYGRGLSSGLPMLVQTAAVLVLAFVLYALLGYDQYKASVVASASLASLAVTGGFVQCIGRLVIYYAEQQSFGLARQISWRLVGCGMTVAAAAAIVSLGSNLVGRWLPLQVAVDAAVYFVLLSTLWLLLAVLYAMQQRTAIVSVFVLSAAVVAVVDRFSAAPLEIAHWTGLLAADAAAATWAWSVLERRSRQDASSESTKKLVRWSLQAYGLTPYFTYGCLYFCFLFADRLLAWTVGHHPLPLWFDAGYEVGLDLAMFVLVLMLPQLEYSLRSFSEWRLPGWVSFPVLQPRSHRRRPGAHRARGATRHDGHQSVSDSPRLSPTSRHFLRFYGRQVLLLVVLGALATAAVSSAFAVLEAASWLPADGQAVARSVFVWGTVGYGLLVVALLNGGLLFSLSRPWPVVGSLALALSTDIAVGWALSRTGDPWWAVGGLVLGALAFAVLTTGAVIRVLRSMEYYDYSAF